MPQLLRIYVDPPAPSISAVSVQVHLVRHCAHSDLEQVLTGRSAGVPLSAQGRAEAARLASAVEHLAPARVQSSPRERAQQTASAIAVPLHLAVDTVDALDEIDFGAWQGRSFAELGGEADWIAWNQHRATARPPGGEAMAEAVARVVGHLDALADDLAQSGDAAICVTHCDIIRGVVAHHLGLGLDRLLGFDVSCGSITTLDFATRPARLVRLNMVPA